MHNLFNVCTNVATIQLLNYREQESKSQFAVYISDTSVSLKQSQGRKKYNDNVDPKQGYNHAKFEKKVALMVSEKKLMLIFFF